MPAKTVAMKVEPTLASQKPHPEFCNIVQAMLQVKRGSTFVTLHAKDKGFYKKKTETAYTFHTHDDPGAIAKRGEVEITDADRYMEPVYCNIFEGLTFTKKGETFRTIRGPREYVNMGMNGRGRRLYAVA